MAIAFVDTNVLVYAAEERIPSPRKTLIARELLLQRDLVISVQVLNEFVANARHPGKLAFTPEQEDDWLVRFLQFEIAPLTLETFLTAKRLHQDHRISHWDSLILAAATGMKCAIVYTEDLNHGQDYDGLIVINPFISEEIF